MKLDKYDNGSLKPTRNNFEYAIRGANITLRYNLMTLSVEGTINDVPVDDVNLRSACVDACADLGIAKGCFEDYAVPIAMNNCFHPAQEFIGNGVWDGKDRLGEVLKCVPVSDEERPFFNEIFSKWLYSVRKAMSLGLNESIVNKRMPVLYGETSSLKTSFISRLVQPIGGAFLEGFFPKRLDRDELFKMGSSLVCEFGEISNVLRNLDADELKNVLSTRSFVMRLPYAKTNITAHRRFAPVGTTNHPGGVRDDALKGRLMLVTLTGKIDLDRVNEILGFSYSDGDVSLVNEHEYKQFWYQVDTVGRIEISEDAIKFYNDVGNAHLMEWDERHDAFIDWVQTKNMLEQGGYKFLPAKDVMSWLLDNRISQREWKCFVLPILEQRKVIKKLAYPVKVGGKSMKGYRVMSLDM